MATSSTSRQYAAFVVHRGPEAKHLAAEIKQELEKQHIETFVDETDLVQGQKASSVMEQTLLHAKAAIVLFTPNFFSSHYCVEELDYVLERHGTLQTCIPVYVSSTVEQVYDDARNHYGREFAAELKGIVAIRHMGEDMNNPNWAKTVQKVCKAIQGVHGIKDSHKGDTAAIKLGCLSPWKQRRRKYKELKETASAAAEEISKPSPVWILSHTDTRHFAAQLENLLASHQVGTVRHVQSTEGGISTHAAKLLRAQVAVIVYCSCIFETIACQQLMRLCADYQRPCVAVYYMVTKHKMNDFAVDAAGLEFATQIFDNNIVVKHKDMLDDSGTTWKLESETMQEVCRAVMKYVEPLPAAANSAGAMPTAAVASSAPSLRPTPPLAPVVGSVVPALQAAGWPALAAASGSGMASVAGASLDMWPNQQQGMPQFQQPTQLVPMWQRAIDVSMQCAPDVSGVAYKSPMLPPTGYPYWQHEVALQQPITQGLSSATGHGCILTVGELPAGTAAGAMYLYSCAQSWAAAAAEAGGPGAASTRVFAASAGGGMVAWCQQGWGVFLPPGAPDVPHVRCPAPILAADLDSKGAMLRLHLGWGGVNSSGSLGASGSGSAGSGRSGTASSSSFPRPHILIKAGPSLHTLELVDGLEPGVQLPPELLLSEELLLLTVANAGCYFHSQTSCLLVLKADAAVVNELNRMVAAFPDIPVVEGLYHALLQPGSQLAAWATQSSSTELNTQHKQAIAASRATAVYCLLVLAIKQGAVLAAEWLLDRLAAFQMLAQPGSASTLSALVEQQQQAWAGASQHKLLLLAAAGGERMQQLFMSWSSQLNLPTDLPAEANISELLHCAIEDIKQAAAVTAEAAETVLVPQWTELAHEPRLLQASSLQEVVTVLGPASDLAAAVMAGLPTDSVQQLLEGASSSTQELGDALSLAMLLGPGCSADTTKLLQQMVQRHRDASHALAVGERGTGSTHNPSNTVIGGSSFSVPAWCMGLVGSSSGVLGWLAGASSSELVGQHSITSLLRHLRTAEPQLFQPLPAYRGTSERVGVKPSASELLGTVHQQERDEVDLGKQLGVKASTGEVADAQLANEDQRWLKAVEQAKEKHGFKANYLESLKPSTFADAFLNLPNTKEVLELIQLFFQIDRQHRSWKYSLLEEAMHHGAGDDQKTVIMLLLLTARVAAVAHALQEYEKERKQQIRLERNRSNRFAALYLLGDAEGSEADQIRPLSTSTFADELLRSAGLRDSDMPLTIGLDYDLFTGGLAASKKLYDADLAAIKRKRDEIVQQVGLLREERAQKQAEVVQKLAVVHHEFEVDTASKLLLTAFKLPSL